MYKNSKVIISEVPGSGKTHFIKYFLTLCCQNNNLPYGWKQTFKDVEPGTWYYEGVEYVNDLGLMTGMGRVFCGIGKRKIIGKENLRRRWKFHLMKTLDFSG